MSELVNDLDKAKGIIEGITGRMNKNFMPVSVKDEYGEELDQGDIKTIEANVRWLKNQSDFLESIDDITLANLLIEKYSLKVKMNGSKKNKELGDMTDEHALNLLKQVYQRLNLLQEFYFDDSPANNKITSLWIIGTYIFNSFNAFPYLQFNAMKGSGKTRKLKFVQSTCWNGQIMIDLTDSVLFRSAQNATLILDECENIASKEKNSLRLILNAGYKKGGAVPRIKKVNSKEGERYEIENFEVYAPKALANINGLEDVLADRAITLIMDKSDDPTKVNLIENFTEDRLILDVKRTLDLIKCSLCSVVSLKNNHLLGYHWNVYTLTTYNTLTTLTTLNTLKPLTLTEEDFNSQKDSPMEEWELNLFEKISKIGINGRNLEVYFPLFVIANLIGGNTLDELIEIAKDKVSEKRKEEGIENRDISLIEYISKKNSGLAFVSIRDLTIEFKDFYMDDEDLTFINSKWLGKALRRLNLVLDKRRVGKGSEVMLNVAKAKEKIKMFKEVEITPLQEVKNV